MISFRTPTSLIEEAKFGFHSKWLPERFVARLHNLLKSKGAVRALDLDEPYYIVWNDHALQIVWGKRPEQLKGFRPLTKRQRLAYEHYKRRLNPLAEARRYHAELNRVGGRTKAEVSKHFNVSRPRVVQFLNLLTLDDRIIAFLDTFNSDPVVASTFTERRLRDLIGADNQWEKFQKILEEARSQQGVWDTLASRPPTEASRAKTGADVRPPSAESRPSCSS